MCVCDLFAYVYTGGTRFVVSSKGLLLGIESAQNFDSGKSDTQLVPSSEQSSVHVVALLDRIL